jgi:hypothetical protein
MINNKLVECILICANWARNKSQSCRPFCARINKFQDRPASKGQGNYSAASSQHLTRCRFI